MREFFVIIKCICILTLLNCIHGSTLLGQRSAVLDSEGKYKVTWQVDREMKMITFWLRVKTTGFVGFGISPSGSMKGADIIIGGVFANGSSYFEDRFGEGNFRPVKDKKEDWTLLKFKQADGFTSLKFSRLLTTCDPQDVPITESVQRFIWAIGSSDTLEYHGVNRGSYVISIMDPPSPQIDLTKYQTWSISTSVKMPAKQTTYWCMVSQSPNFTTKQHVVAFGPKMESKLSKRHSHHLVVNKCRAPPGEDRHVFFKRFVDAGGQDCGRNGMVKGAEIFMYCTETFYAWAMGARELITPENVAFPIGENGIEYFLLELHIDNPAALPDLQFESGVQIYYTPNLRPIEAGLLNVGIEPDWRMVIPPGSTDFHVAAHCVPGCTKDIPPEGYTMFNVQLHAHNSGKKMRLRLFRDGEELPWVSDDQTYDNHFQENRNVPIVKLLPGDQLTLECGYDNTWVQPPGTVIGGYSTREEMCDTMIYYYPKGRLFACGSGTLGDPMLEILGIRNISEFEGSTNPIITSPEAISGYRYLEYLDSKLNWTDDLRKAIEKEMTVGPHFGYCEFEPLTLSGEQLGHLKPMLNSNNSLNYSNFFNEDNRPKSMNMRMEPIASYPKLKSEYHKVDECVKNNNNKLSNISLTSQCTRSHFSLILLPLSLFSYYMVWLLV